MAQSPTHTFGQKIGELLEELLHPLLHEVAEKHKLYLDYQHAREARKGRKKVAWRDNKGNSHDLDFVLEAGGSETQVGSPKAFIECAWRSYTKHSRNKAQEMQGAIVPLSETYHHDHPFLGAVLAGVFTEGSLSQLRSHSFGILFFPRQSIVAAFASVGVDTYFDEETPDAQVKKKLNAYMRLKAAERGKLVEHLRQTHAGDIRGFLGLLQQTLTRRVVGIAVMTLHGPTQEVASVDAAVAYVEQYEEVRAVTGFIRYEIIVRYNTGQRHASDFDNKFEAIAFLRGLG